MTRLSSLVLAGALALALVPAAPATAAPRARPAARTDDRALAGLGRKVAAEINLLRKDPKAYARHLRALRAAYDGKLWRLPGRDPIRTREGVAALDEAIRVLTRTKPRKPLAWEVGLARAAADHARELGRDGTLTHGSRDGGGPFERIARHGVLQGVGGENIDVGFRDPRMVVIHLLIDDNVPDRGHRVALLEPAYRQVGVACGPHKVYGVVCVMDFAAGFSSVPAGSKRR